MLSGARLNPWPVLGASEKETGNKKPSSWTKKQPRSPWHHGTGKELSQKVLARWAAREVGGWQQQHEAAKGGDSPVGTRRGATRGNLPVPMILSILMLALSSSLAKRCTACMGSSHVSGSMYVRLVGILTAGEQGNTKRA